MVLLFSISRQTYFLSVCSERSYCLLKDICMAALTPMSHGSNATGTSAGVHRHTHSEIFLVLGVPSDSLRNLTFGCRTGHWVPGTALEGRGRCCLPPGWRQVQVPPCVTPNRGCSLLLGVWGGLISPLCREVGVVFPWCWLEQSGCCLNAVCLAGQSTRVFYPAGQRTTHVFHL